MQANIFQSGGCLFFFSSRRRHTRFSRDWSSDVCSSDLDRWERMVTGTPWVASCTVTVDQDLVDVCSGPEAADSLTYGAFGEGGTREFFTHVRFHKHDEDKITIHLLVELYARSAEEASEVLEEASRGQLTITSLAEESRPPAAESDEAH